MTDKELYQELMRRLNGPARKFQDVFVEEFKKEHPTLQQSLARHLIAPALLVLSELRPDARNEASHDFAVHAMQRDTYFPTI